MARPPTQLASTRVHHILLLEEEWLARPPTQLASPYTRVHHILLLEEEWLDPLHN